MSSQSSEDYSYGRYSNPSTMQSQQHGAHSNMHYHTATFPGELLIDEVDPHLVQLSPDYVHGLREREVGSLGAVSFDLPLWFPM